MILHAIDLNPAPKATSERRIDLYISGDPDGRRSDADGVIGEFEEYLKTQVRTLPSFVDAGDRRTLRELAIQAMTVDVTHANVIPHRYRGWLSGGEGGFDWDLEYELDLTRLEAHDGGMVLAVYRVDQP